LRAGNTDNKTQNEITTRTLVRTTKNKLENREYESRTNLRGLGMELASLTWKGAKLQQSSFYEGVGELFSEKWAE